MYERSYGAKYDGSLSTVEIAKLVRADIKAAVADGTLPRRGPHADIKYSVRTEKFAGGSAINVSIKHFPETTELPRDFTTDRYGQPLLGRHMTTEAVRIKGVIEAIVAAYNHDGSEVQVDYFDVNFYSSVTFDWQTTPRQTQGYLRGWLVPLDEKGHMVRADVYEALTAESPTPGQVALVEMTSMPVDPYDLVGDPRPARHLTLVK